MAPVKNHLLTEYDKNSLENPVTLINSCKLFVHIMKNAS